MEKPLKRQEPCFWITDNCPACGHSCPAVYSPDLLKGPLDRVCGSRNNPIRKNNICHNEWGFAATEKKKQEIRELLKLAARQDELWQEYQKNRKILGYH